MVDTTFPYQIVILTQDYSITGGLFLKDQRLSDFLNDKRDTTILLRNANIARLEDPAKIMDKTPFSIIPKAGIVLASPDEAERVIPAMELLAKLGCPFETLVASVFSAISARLKIPTIRICRSTTGR